LLVGIGGQAARIHRRVIAPREPARILCLVIALGEPASNVVPVSAGVRSNAEIPGVVGTPTADSFTTLAAVLRDAKTLSRRIWISALLMAAVAVVILSWRVPEPENQRPSSTQSVENISYLRCAPQYVAPPSYGTRALSNDCTQ
jgi:hypothetical protein